MAIFRRISTCMVAKKKFSTIRQQKNRRGRFHTLSGQYSEGFLWWLRKSFQPLGNKSTGVADSTLYSFRADIDLF